MWNNPKSAIIETPAQVGYITLGDLYFVTIADHTMWPPYRPGDIVAIDRGAADGRRVLSECPYYIRFKNGQHTLRMVRVFSDGDLLQIYDPRNLFESERVRKDEIEFLARATLYETQYVGSRGAYGS